MTLEDVKKLLSADCISIAEDLVNTTRPEYIQKAHVYAVLAIAKILQKNSDTACKLSTPYSLNEHAKTEE